MSRTFKDRPPRLVNLARGHIDHDHRDGICDVETHHRPHRSRGWHRDCTKRVQVAYTCTRTDRHLDPRTGVPTCYRGDHHPVYRPDGTWTVEFTWTSCIGHVRTEQHPETPCVCDTWPDPPTCTVDWRWGRTSDPAPRWYRDHVWNNPERRRERDDLRSLAKIANAVGNLAHLDDTDDDFDFANHQHHHSAAWW